MLVKLKFRFPEIVLGGLLAIAVFGMGMVFSSQQPSPTAQSQNTDNLPNEGAKSQPDEGLWHWLTHEAAGFFTLWLVIVGGGQLALFYVQLRLIRESLTPAKDAAEAARLAANAAVDANRPWLNIKDVQFKEPLIILESAAYSTITVQIENVGRSPAIDASVWVEMLPVVHGEKVGDVQVHVVSEATRRNFKASGNVVFSGQTVPQGIIFSIPMDQLVRGRQSMDGIDQVSLYLGVCTCYRIGESPDIKHTCRIFLLGWVRLDAGETGVSDLNNRIGTSHWDTAT